jgi:nucleotide-binding universal stress UspA family protein
MRFPKGIAFFLLLMCCVAAAGKDKKKILLPADVLQAETVLVVIDPDAGVALDAPNANRTAREAVERALMNWGRLRLAPEVSTADLVITVRRGNGKIAQPTIGGLPTNSRPVILQPTNSGGRVGGSEGTPPMAGDPTGPQTSHPTPQVEVGSADDVFEVYRGKSENALDTAPVWRYSGKDALRSPDVPAVDAFRKLVVEAEKQRAANP